MSGTEQLWTGPFQIGYIVRVTAGTGFKQMHGNAPTPAQRTAMER